MAPSKDSKGAKKRPSSNRVRLETDAFKVDADALQLSDFYAKLIMDPRFRKKFEANPVRALKAAGFSITDEVAAQMTPDLIQQRLDGLIEGADSQQCGRRRPRRRGVAGRHQSQHQSRDEPGRQRRCIGDDKHTDRSRSDRTRPGPR